jgi:probable rRNA maturation factor
VTTKSTQRENGFSIDVDVIVDQNVSIRIDDVEFEAIAEYVLAQHAVTGHWAVAFVITTDEHLRQLHRDYMGIDDATDVMTFPAMPCSGATTAGGDIVISVDRATEQAPDFGHTPMQEIRFLAVHGLLHLLGWDDDTTDARAMMLNRQRQLLSELMDAGSLSDGGTPTSSDSNDLRMTSAADKAERR